MSALMPILVVLLIVAIVAAIYAMRSDASARKAREERGEMYRGCFLRGLAGLLAKMASADGVIDEGEVKVAEKLLKDMGLQQDELELCIGTFRGAKEEDLPVSYYASLLVPYSTREARVLLYEVLWDIAAADGEFAEKEAEFLRSLLSWFELDKSHYDYNVKRCSSKFGEALASAYITLGCTEKSSQEELLAAYRDQLAKYDVDRLSKEGLPVAFISQAAKKAAEIEKAWEVIRNSQVG